MKHYHLPLLLLLALSTQSASRTVVLNALPPGTAPAHQAPIALLVDLSSGQTLYDRGGGAGFLPASMTKAMTSLIAFDLIAAGKLDENAMITVRPETAARWAGKGTSLNLRPGEQVRVGDLLMGTTVVSANDAAVALAEGALGSTQTWVEAMNARAQKLGMNGSHFGTPNGMPDRAVTHVSASDMVKLAEALINKHPALYRRYIGKQAMAWRGLQLTSHDPFAGVVPGADGIKTGFTREAGFNFLGAVERDRRRLVVVIGRSPTEPDRAAAAKALIEWGYSAFDSHSFLDPEWIVGSVKVQGGDARQVPVAVPRAYSIAQHRDHPGSVVARIVYDGPVRAPIAKGAQVATLVVSVEGQRNHTLPLVATRSVAKAGPIDRIVGGLLGLLE